MKIVGVIPARYKSSRFEGKPLAIIQGKPMIWWVYQQAIKVKEFQTVYVATEDERIKIACEDLGINVIMTSDQHKTGTDRVGEVAKKIKADLYVNIQGDEPMIESRIIIEAIKPFFNNKELQVSNLMTIIRDHVDILNFTIPKVITNKEGIGIYVTRSAAPYPKGSIDFSFYKQVGVYGFTAQALDFYCSNPRGKLESIEDIEILRFIENGYKVQFIEVNSDTVAVDTPNDLEKVRKKLKKIKGKVYNE
jgi:3-deoxy-manno-octulosonate cytidylyltransferase (CMP-KDO synthetase)